MSEWHLQQLEERILRRGWRVVGTPHVDNVQIAGSWELERGDDRVVLDFYGFDDLVTFPIEQAYAVEVRGCGETTSLYFGKKPSSAHPNRSWEQDLGVFISALDDLYSAA